MAIRHVFSPKNIFFPSSFPVHSAISCEDIGKVFDFWRNTIPCSAAFMVAQRQHCARPQCITWCLHMIYMFEKSKTISLQIHLNETFEFQNTSICTLFFIVKRHHQNYFCQQIAEPSNSTKVILFAVQSDHQVFIVYYATLFCEVGLLAAFCTQTMNFFIVSSICFMITIFCFFLQSGCHSIVQSIGFL